MNTLKSRKAWFDILQVPKENKCQSRLLYPAELSFLIDGEIKSFHDKQNLKEHMTIKLALQKILEGILHTEREDKHIKEKTEEDTSQEKVDKHKRTMKESSIKKTQNVKNYYTLFNNNSKY
jgi:hypothetical protein